MNKDLKNNIATCFMMLPATTTATATTNLADLQGFESAAFLVQYGTLTNADAGDYFTAKLQESDSVVGTTFTDVAAADLIGAFTDTTATTANIQRVGYIGKKRYVRVVITETADTNNITGIISVVALLANARHQVASDVAPTTAT